MLQRARTGPIDRLVGARMRARRVAMGVTPTAMAARLCCSPGEVLDFESGARRLGATSLMRLADICGVDLGYFFAEVPSDPMRRAGADQTSSSS